MSLTTDLPARVLECFVVSQVGVSTWPFNDGSGDPYWRYGSSPRDYRWKVVLNVTAQSHSSHRTRVPELYTGLDVKVGDYIASAYDGTAVKVVQIDRKTDAEVTCVVEDVFRYNTFRDPSGIGIGIFTVPSNAIIFQLNESGMPVVDPLPQSGVGVQFFPNLMSRFQNREKTNNFILEKEDHGFTVGKFVSADQTGNSFQLSSPSHPYIIGQISQVPSKDHFLVTPMQKIIDTLDTLPGEVGDVIYADSATPGAYTLSVSGAPLMVKLRNNTPSTAVSLNANAVSTAGATLTINGEDHSIGGTRSIADLVTAVNLKTANTGVTATSVRPPLTITTTQNLLNTQFGEPLFSLPTNQAASPRAVINGVSVSFTTYVDGAYRYGGARYSTAYDMAEDINAAMTAMGYANVVATATGATLSITEQNGATLAIQNVVTDILGQNFAGTNSASGLPTSAAANTGNLAKLVAADARPIDLANKVGTPVEDYGIFSSENGVKAAAIFLDQSALGDNGDTRIVMTAEGVSMYDNGLPFAVLSGATNQSMWRAEGSSPHVNIVIDPKGSGVVNMSAARVTSVANAVADNDAINRVTADTRYVARVGATVSGANATTAIATLNATILRTVVLVQSAFLANATMTVGTSGSPSAILSTADVDLTNVAVYEITNMVDVNGTISAVVTNGGSGAAKIVVEYLPNT